MIPLCTNAGKSNHATGEYGPLVFLTDMMSISPHEQAHKPDELIIYKKGKLFYMLMNNVNSTYVAIAVKFTWAVTICVSLLLTV